MKMYSPQLPRRTGSGRKLPATPVEGNFHKRILEVKSSDPLSGGLLSPEMRQPLRSQSFKHRGRPTVEVKRNVYEDISGERRKSTPTISRRSSMQRTHLPRTDVWPEAKPASEVEERFLKLPDCEDYTRVRQFKIDEKGTVVSRGDSFRRKNNSKGDKSPSPYIKRDSVKADSDSVDSSDESTKKNVDENDPSGSHSIHKIYVVGDTGTGKTSLISQFGTSEYRNAFTNEAIEKHSNTVSINIGGEESELIFLESDMADPLFIDDTVHAFLFLYCIDSRSTFKQALNGIEMVRNRPSCRHIPILIAGNKADLERKRAISTAEVRAATAAYGLEHFEISVALNHDVDDLLVGLLAEIKDAFGGEEKKEKKKEKDEFHAAIRRYSQRKKKQTDTSELTGGKCSSLSPSGLIHRLFHKRGSTPRIEQ